MVVTDLIVKRKRNLSKLETVSRESNICVLNFGVRSCQEFQNIGIVLFHQSFTSFVIFLYIIQTTFANCKVKVLLQRIQYF